MFAPTFRITPEINSLVAKIEHFRALVDQATILPELEVQLRFRATVESVHSSTSIEGNPLNEQQVQTLLHGDLISAPDYAIREVMNYRRAFDWLYSQVQSNQDLMANDILHLHNLVMDKLLPKEKVGHFRPGDVYIVDEIGNQEIVRYTGPQAEDVPQLVSSLLKWITSQKQTDLHPILLAGLIHYLFVSIHPFSDGNGRTTRLLTSYFLKKWKYDFRGTLALETYYVQHQKEYYESLSRGDTFDNRMCADLTPFIHFFVTGFLASVESLSQYIKAGRVLGDNNKQLRLSSEELIILDYTYQFGSMTIQEAIEALLVSKRTAQRRLMGLVEKGILTIEGQGPATRYVLKQKIDAQLK